MLSPCNVQMKVSFPVLKFVQYNSINIIVLLLLLLLLLFLFFCHTIIQKDLQII